MIEVQYRLMVRERGQVRDHLGVVLTDPDGLLKVVSRMVAEPGNYPNITEVWIERREVTITPWVRAD